MGDIACRKPCPITDKVLNILHVLPRDVQRLDFEEEERRHEEDSGGDIEADIDDREDVNKRQSKADKELLGLESLEILFAALRSIADRVHDHLDQIQGCQSEQDDHNELRIRLALGRELHGLCEKQATDYIEDRHDTDVRIFHFQNKIPP